MSIYSIPRSRAIVVAACLSFAADAAGQGITKPKQGQGGSVVQGAAGTSSSTGDKGLQHCDKPMGAVAVVEPQDYVMQRLNATGSRLPCR